MRKFEYKRVLYYGSNQPSGLWKTDEEYANEGMNALGAEGWEAITVIEGENEISVWYKKELS